MWLEDEMPARDTFHEPFVRALEKDGWTITDDPLTVPYGRTELLVDIGAEKLVAAERNGLRIAVEIKSFISPSPIHDLKEALGAYFMYSNALADSAEHADRTLYLAIRQETFDSLFSDQSGQKIIQRGQLRLIVFHTREEVILQWIP
jgi:hypothetical protein